MATRKTTRTMAIPNYAPSPAAGGLPPVTTRAAAAPLTSVPASAPRRSKGKAAKKKK